MSRPRTVDTSSNKCTFYICDAPYYAKGYCRRHYTLFLIKGKVEYHVPMRERGLICSLEYCDNPVYIFKDMLCNGHYKQKYDGKEFKPLSPYSNSRRFIDENGRVCTKCGEYKVWKNNFYYNTYKNTYEGRCIPCFTGAQHERNNS